MQGHVEIAEMIIVAVEDKNPKNQFGETPLHFAAREGHATIVKMIIDAVDDKNPQDFFGNTPLIRAEENGHEDISKLIKSENFAYKSCQAYSDS